MGIWYKGIQYLQGFPPNSSGASSRVTQSRGWSRFVGFIPDKGIMEKTDFSKSCLDIKLLLFDCDGVLTDGRIILGGGGLDIKFFSTRDGLGISLWHKAGLSCGCITGRFSEALQRRAEELSFEELHLKADDKRAVVAGIRSRRNLSKQEVAYVGDDLNDLCVRPEVGLFFAPADAHQTVITRSDFHLGKPGGHGAVRETIDIILSEKRILDDLIAKHFE